ncbi:TOBE domain-containing protein [Ornithinimicrobium pratense]|uniref:Helix-turn-helix domain-containing protein n=1 Tax=Ornithinimicrobium pratense TaxID=2593973 RepID=A0A5J6V8P3_9MICO|nr:TOBE domain-containing protein [Ornithinimicrobium pratense]QFG69453.1 helix-turn-helix domain-containing protein [Ornithinimicrobium pratense]
MTQLRIAEAADLLGVSTDTVRRAIEAGRLTAAKDTRGRTVVEGRDVAALAQDQAHPAEVGTIGSSSARNQMRGVVTRVKSDLVMSQVDVQAGPFRLVSLLSTEAVEEMGLVPGSVVIASVKATHVTVGTPS